MSSTRHTLALACLGAIASPAVAQIPWTPYPAQGLDFTHSGGLSDNGNAGFGVPTVFQNSFDFMPTAFDTTAPAGGSDSIDDRMQVDLTPNSGAIDEVVIIESGMVTGDMTQNIGGGFDSIFTIEGDVTVVTNPSVFPGAVLADVLITIDVIDANTARWTGTAVVDLSPQPSTGFLPVTEARFILENVLTARSFNGIETTVTKDRTQVFIPAPAGLVALSGLGLLASRRRRR